MSDCCGFICDTHWVLGSSNVLRTPVVSEVVHSWDMGQILLKVEDRRSGIA